MERKKWFTTKKKKLNRYRPIETAVLIDHRFVACNKRLRITKKKERNEIERFDKLNQIASEDERKSKVTINRRLATTSGFGWKAKKCSQ
jgi:hypothetical protein